MLALVCFHNRKSEVDGVLPVTATYFGVPERHRWETRDYIFYGDIARESETYAIVEKAYTSIIGWMYYPDIPSKYKTEGMSRFWEDNTPRKRLTAKDLEDE